MLPHPTEKKGGGGKLPKLMPLVSFLAKEKVQAQEQVETLVFLNFIPAFFYLLNVLIQAFCFIYLSAK